MAALEIITNISLLILGIVLLAKGSDELVKSASRIAGKLGVSKFLIGLTLVAVGTSVPEIASAITSSLKGASRLVIGNLVGSNLANIGLSIGIAAAFIHSIRTNEEMLKRDGYIMILVSVLFYIFAFNRVVSPVEGLILLLIYFAYILFLLQARTELQKKLHFAEFLNYFFKFEYLATIRSHAVKAFDHKKPKTFQEKEMTKLFIEGLVKDFLVVLISLAAVIIGARFLIDQALWIAHSLGLVETFIGLTILALSTTLPELAVSINAARKGYSDLLIGNIIGSNIANLALVFPIAAIINPVELHNFSVFYVIPGMLAFSLVFLFFLRNEWKINKIEGLSLLGAYALLIVFLLFKAA